MGSATSRTVQRRLTPTTITHIPTSDLKDADCEISNNSTTKSNVNTLICTTPSVLNNSFVNANTEIKYISGRRWWKIFLRACDNFNTNKDNLMLLLYGYINFVLKEITIYAIIPNELVWYCIAFIYNITKMEDIENKWHSLTVPKCVIFGEYNLQYSNVRKLWRIQIIPTENELTFTIGNSYDCDKYWLFIKNGFIEGINMKFESNDIISILFLKTEYTLLRFAINGNECLTMDGQHIDGRIWIHLYQNAEIKILNDRFCPPLLTKM
eukprot:378441_1